MANKVLVIGDAMIDSYILGKVNRVSPEAPVPVVTPVDGMKCLGGAGNVARNAAALGAEVCVLFAFGNDDDGNTLVEKLKKWNINCDWIIQDSSLHTINKTRVVGNNQQIVRIDYNDHYDLKENIETQLKENVDKILPKYDVIVISDYGKGTCTNSICKYIMSVKKSNQVVIVDPKGIDWKKYKGASIITPNMKEINTYSGYAVKNDKEEIEKAYVDLNRQLGIEYVLLTRSEEGMSLLGGDKVKHISAYSHEVYDVSGAGDTVVATLATYIEADLDNIWEAAHLANLAAGIVVAKPGTAVVTLDEIQRQLAIDSLKKDESKVYTLDEYDRLKDIVNSWRTAGYQIVTANGCFDIIHKGHIKLLQEAKKHGDKLIVAINSDESVKRLKGEDRPVNNEIDRAFVMSALDSVDAVVIFDPYKTPVELTEEELSCLSEKARKSYKEAPMALMKMIQPNVHVKGGDYKKEDVPEAAYAERFLIANFENGYSTTNIIEKISM